MKTVSWILAVSVILTVSVICTGCASTSVSKISFEKADDFKVGIELTKEY